MKALKPLHDQIIVLTGASSGIGRATAKMAADAGAKLVLAARSENALNELVDDINSAGGEAVAVVADVGVEEDVDKIAATAIANFGRLDTWVNNAGVSIYGKLTDVPLEDQRRLFDTNYWGVVYGSLAAAAHLARDGGAIINVGSIVSDRALPLQGAYSASKHAVKGFTDALRVELEHEELPVSVTLIKPGAIDTPYTQHAKNYLEVEPKFPPPVYAPEVVAEAILHCAENPVRDMFVGGSGKLYSAAEKYAPRVTDKLMGLLAFDAQKSDKPRKGRKPSGLYNASGGGSTRGNHDGYVAESSIYTKSAMHPTLIAGGLLLAGIGLAYAVASRRAGGDGQRKLDTNTPLQTAVVRETFEAKLDHDFSGTQERSL
jgi:NAD(P)-dependent dehydrogenase (short-subunit alcohol dehydrogenase family)